ncbi:MAG: hypothetical protein LBK64_06630, partial [Spirochaetaceae bacterium]|nr:hypothetical protein [Spirochaetaceae bacterium]
MKIEGIGKPEGCKLIRISAELENDIINSIQIRGDFFASPEEAFDRIEKVLEGTKARDLSKVFDSFIREKGIETYGINGQGLAEVLASAIGAG